MLIYNRKTNKIEESKEYQESDSYEEWYERVKKFANDHNYASEVKAYKENPENYKGHVGDICEMIRYALTGRTKTPDLYQLLSIFGKENLQKRIDFFEKHFKIRYTNYALRKQSISPKNKVFFLL